MIGFDLRPDPLTATNAVELIAVLNRYRQWAGEPSFRAMAAQARQRVAHSTMFTALHGDQLPKLKVVLAIVAGCGGGEDDQRAFASAWRRIKFGRLDVFPTADRPPFLGCPVVKDC